MATSARPKNALPAQQQENPGRESPMEPRPKYEGRDYKAPGKAKGVVDLITGGHSGIGRSVAVLCAKESADAAIVYLPNEQSDAEETKRMVEKQCRRIHLR
jgi:hypothetical protein